MEMGWGSVLEVALMLVVVVLLLVGSRQEGKKEGSGGQS